ncbi:MAG TPA: hypothetical protein VFA82_03540 [Gaiellaceae bacterium]|nr:hypothetical protein [Gaiellaceae bacterium]
MFPQLVLPNPRAGRLAALAAAGLLAAGCGGATSPRDATAWRANASGVLLQLRDDVAQAAVAGQTVGEARRALRDESDLFALVIVYSDLGGCRAMVRNAGAPARVEAALALPCPVLERAAATFSHAVARSDADALLRAGREARDAQRLIVRALAALRAA